MRLVNLQAGQLDMVERLGPTDVATVQAEPEAAADRPAGAGLLLDEHQPGRARQPAEGPRVRAALEASIDRVALNQVVIDGQFIPSNQFEAPGSRYWDPDHPVPPRDLAKAKALLQQAGQAAPQLSLLIGNSPVEQQVGEVMQSMADEAGFDIKLQAAEANALVAAGRGRRLPGDGGDLERPADPDGNVAIWLACDGFLNWGKYCNPTFDDAAATRARRHRRGAAPGAVPAGRRHLPRRSAAHRAVPREMAVGAERQGVRLHADAGRADPAAGHDARAMTTRIDGDRLLGDLRALRKIGAYKTGVHRPTYSPEDVERGTGSPRA